MKSNSIFYRHVLIAILVFFSSIFSSLYGEIWDDEQYNYQITCGCYPSNFATTYSAVRFDTHLYVGGDRYEFEFVEQSGDLEINYFDKYIDPAYWYHDAWGYYPTSPINYTKYMKLYFNVLKNDIEPGASRTFKLRWKTRHVGVATWSEWEYTDPFTVSVSDIDVSGQSGTLCTTSRTYSISAPSGYSTTWSFSNSSLVTTSSGTGTSALLTGSCNVTGDGVLTFTMTQSNCPTFQASRTINVNGPDPTDLSFRALYTDGSPAPKSGSIYLLCPYTHYHIYLDNDISYSCGVSNLTWTIPANWTKNYQYANMISIYTGASPGGQVIVKGQTCCASCGSNMSLLTGYFGNYYNCGGYYMAIPNPGSEFIDIDFSPEAAELKETSSSIDLEIKLVDKMGTVVCSDNVYSFPYRINTGKLPEGNYVVMIRDKKASTKTYDSFQVVIEH